MTVDDLLVAIRKAFALFDDDAQETWAPVFRRQLRQHEGKALNAAWLATMAGFKPSNRQVFPIPIDFEVHLPKATRTFDVRAGRKLDFEAHKARKAELIDRWARRERPKIEEAYGGIVAQRCLDEVTRIADGRAWHQPKPSEEPDWIVLSDEHVALCESTVVASERNFVYGPQALHAHDPHQWLEQTAYCRSLIRSGFSPSREAHRHRAEMAKADKSRAIAPLNVTHKPTSKTDVAASNEGEKINMVEPPPPTEEPATEEALDW